MPEFRKPRLSDRELIINRVNEGTTDGTSYSFGSIFTWGDVYSVEIAEFGELLLMRGKDENGRYYVYPSGRGDIKDAVLELMADAEKEGVPFVLGQLLEPHKKVLESLFPDTFDFFYDRDNSEYVYSVKNMAELPGKKFHGKKGHVNAFFRNHTDIHIDPITRDNIHLCLDIEKQWLDGRKDENNELHNEFGAIEKAVKNYKALGFEGAILYADGKPVAFTMGEPIKNNTFCTHFEKTAPEYRDAYPVINNGFTKLMLSTYEFVNREEDTGAEGLRKAKLSYNPVFLLDKYYALPKIDKNRKFRAEESDKTELKKLWQTVFGDKDDVVDYFFDYAAEYYDAYVYRCDGKIVSAFYLLDADIVTASERKKCKYLYAAATLPEYRNRGFMGEMIEYAAEYLKNKGFDCLFLCPAEESLFGYYEKFGFKSAFKENYYNINKSDLVKYKNSRYFCSEVSYSDIRKNIPSETYVDFSDGFIDFAAFCNKKYGFRQDAVFDDEDKVVILGSGENGRLVIEEAVSENGNYKNILSVLADSEFESFVLKTPADIILSDFECNERFSGMIINLNGEEIKETAYLGQPCM